MLYKLVYKSYSRYFYLSVSFLALIENLHTNSYKEAAVILLLRITSSHSLEMLLLTLLWKCYCLDLWWKCYCWHSCLKKKNVRYRSAHTPMNRYCAHLYENVTVHTPLGNDCGRCYSDRSLNHFKPGIYHTHCYGEFAIHTPLETFVWYSYQEFAAHTSMGMWLYTVLFILHTA